MHKITFSFLSFLLFAGAGFAQQNGSIATIDVVRVKAQFEKEALYFYRQNWEMFRAEALKQGHISAYQLLKTATDSTGHFQLVLITEYPDSLTRARAEEHFAPIMKALRPDGPKMLNNVPRNEMLTRGESFEGQNIVYGSTKRKKRRRK